MKNNIFSPKQFHFTAGLCILALLFVLSCKKYNSAGFTAGTGTPSISSVHTWNKIDTTAINDTIKSYDASGNLVESIRSKTNQPYPFDSVTTAGNLGNYYIIYGANLGSATNITFNGYQAYFNRALLTDQSVIVQVPSKTPYYGPQATDSLVITTLHGKAYYGFTILPPPPTPESYSNYDFYEGSQITLKGVGFATVSAVNLVDEADNSAAVTVISQNDSVLVLQFPQTGLTRGNLAFTYDNAGTATTVVDGQELIDLDNAYQIFTDDFDNGWSNSSWSGQAERVTDIYKTGIASFKGVFPQGGWKIEGFANWYPSLPYDASYQYLVFWVKGGTADETVNIETNTSSKGYGQNEMNAITVPANVWTYFKIPLNTIDFWTAGSTLQQLGLFIKGPDDANQELYFDDVVLVK